MAKMPVDLYFEWSTLVQDWNDSYTFRYKPHAAQPFTCQHNTTGETISAPTLPLFKHKVYAHHHHQQRRGRPQTMRWG